jgi:hypothetical protein
MFLMHLFGDNIHYSDFKQNEINTYTIFKTLESFEGSTIVFHITWKEVSTVT